MQWKHFKFLEIHEALAWAAAGNVAVHDTGQAYRTYKHTCHLFCKDEATLRQAAAMVGCNLKYIQRKTSHGALKDFYLTHYDLFGGPLKRALLLCDN